MDDITEILDTNLYVSNETVGVLKDRLTDRIAYIRELELKNKEISEKCDERIQEHDQRVNEIKNSLSEQYSVIRKKLVKKVKQIARHYKR